ncbi:MAG: hypothetical protein J2O48_06545 [Solirubrobacterales bacterium]|nr:hypothetical protein [Solirubrobacterales bacterium]
MPVQFSSEGSLPLGADGSAWADAFELLVEVLSRGEQPDAGADAFYTRVSDAVCQLARMRRAVIFRYDPGSRRVRAAGAHRIDLGPFKDAHMSVESAPFTAEALAKDQLVEVSGDLRGYFPPEYHWLVSDPAQLVCAPMATGGRQVGVILADRALDDPPLEDAERQLLWTLGKAAALATVARRYVTDRETARQLEHRIDLAREVHEHVIQRLFGVSLALDGDGDLPAEARKRCAEETQEALSDLRVAMQRPLGRAPRGTATTFAAELQRIKLANPQLGLALVEGDSGDVPQRLEPLAQSVLREAARNAGRHAQPSAVEVRIQRQNGSFILTVDNDGVAAAAPRNAGIGLRLAAFEALHNGGMVEFGEHHGGNWRVRLIAPLSDTDGGPGGDST